MSLVDGAVGAEGEGVGQGAEGQFVQELGGSGAWDGRLEVCPFALVVGVEGAALVVEGGVLGPALEAAGQCREAGGLEAQDADEEDVDDGDEDSACQYEGEAEDVDVAA